VPGTDGERALGWGGALLLAAAALSLAVVDPVPLVLVPLAVLLLGLPPRHLWWAVMGLAMGVLAVAIAVGPLTTPSLVWAALLAGGFLTVTLRQPEWSPFSRALAVVGIAFVLGAGWLAASGQLAAFDLRMQEHFQTIAAQTVEQMRQRFGESPLVVQFGESESRIAHIQWMLYPAVLALQSLAALALGWWALLRLRGAELGHAPLGVFGRFRFSDQLVWLLIGALVLIVLPASGVVDRIGWNLLFVMASLYAIRGIAVIVFLLAGVPRVLLLVSALAALFLYPIVPMAALLVGLGDTWLDVRRRVAVAART
jgi:hypothetical protein